MRTNFIKCSNLFQSKSRRTCILTKMSRKEGSKILEYSETCNLTLGPDPLVKFDVDDAFNLGIMARSLILEKIREDGYVIEICSADDHCLFRCCTSSDTTVGNDWRLELKRQAALKHRNSSFELQKRIGSYMNSKLIKSTRAYLLENKHTVITEGAVLIFVKGVSFPVGCFAIDKRDPCFRIEHIAKYCLYRYSQEQLQKQEQKLELEISKRVEEKLKLDNPIQKIDGEAWKLFKE
ncbi:ZYRO0A11924p [Zygosaccharomyces rouxii]|uniref:ZYRO0A11924p n=1 Tax=Zygosaccharomyces rouxii (strain ATCC 2623 / CBS 732 / NBRC 1130 / NCYC 568 / NRRL Y-229) TaxID=559307 RepID=C5DNW0_ZYGRC|nr:uncharacterized protein ZYRO0A11924g [Zygosaccharomyces rouxii]KAH9198525.1 hypothetical protein LQ764DRAFT_138538 [Zygosaccharomyces rouxii]CAR25951.1 ZYRO0A11924p [Zygosaccharomyces rouxii]